METQNGQVLTVLERHARTDMHGELLPSWPTTMPILGQSAVIEESATVQRESAPVTSHLKATLARGINAGMIAMGQDFVCRKEYSLIKQAMCTKTRGMLRSCGVASATSGIEVQTAVYGNVPLLMTLLGDSVMKRAEIAVGEVFVIIALDNAGVSTVTTVMLVRK